MKTTVDVSTRASIERSQPYSPLCDMDESMQAPLDVVYHGRHGWPRLLIWSRYACVIGPALLLGLLVFAASGSVFRGSERHPQVASAFDNGILVRFEENATSCAQRGCAHEFDASLDCQCDVHCRHYRNCCVDWNDYCEEEIRNDTKSEPQNDTHYRTREAEHTARPANVTFAEKEQPNVTFSCQEYGCVPFQPHHACQCNEGCRIHNTCCEDAVEFCNDTNVTGNWESVRNRLAEYEKRNRRRAMREAKKRQAFAVLIRHPPHNCSMLSLGDNVEVRDSATSDWLLGKVASLNPVRVQPQGWDLAYAWDAFRQGHVICRPQSAQMVSITSCRNARHGDDCYSEIKWIMDSDLEENPDRYPGLDPNATLHVIQSWMYQKGNTSCFRPCLTVPSAPSCLCLFDVDRTLTGHQGNMSSCPGTQSVHGVLDGAFGGGPLLLSELGRNIKETFCTRCYRGAVSAGSASGPHSPERKVLLEMLGGAPRTLGDVWSSAKNVGSLLVVGAIDQFKQHSVRQVVDWLREHKGVHIDDQNVHFFDDHDKNVPPFKGTGFNAKQVSCGSRGRTVQEQFVGFCGGRISEVSDESGVHPCPPPPVVKKQILAKASTALPLVNTRDRANFRNGSSHQLEANVQGDGRNSSLPTDAARNRSYAQLRANTSHESRYAGIARTLEVVLDEIANARNASSSWPQTRAYERNASSS